MNVACIRHQFADDDGHEHQRNGHDGDRQHGYRSVAKGEPSLEEWAHELTGDDDEHG